MKCKLIGVCNAISKTLDLLKDIPLLLIRLTLAYGFYTPAMNKWSDIESVAGWFESMNYPLPILNAYMAASVEIAGVVLLTLGFASRVISIPLIFVMLVAIFTVHGGNGFEASANGFEIPLYYLVMLFTILVYGPGKYSLDGIIRKNQE
ncbi:MAG: DoxX family membrane protein [Bacteroidales bacterium]|nr:DoxX family membrane protein [Bacteroidales bacterium]